MQRRGELDRLGLTELRASTVRTTLSVFVSGLIPVLFMRAAILMMRAGRRRRPAPWASAKHHPHHEDEQEERRDEPAMISESRHAICKD